MATRASIVVLYNRTYIDGQKVAHIYHHWDGAPQYLGRNLKKFLDENYKEKWQTQQHYDCLINALLKGEVIDAEGDRDDGFKWSDHVHGDIDYLYVLDCDDRTLRCFKRSIRYCLNVDDYTLQGLMNACTEVSIPDE